MTTRHHTRRPRTSQHRPDNGGPLTAVANDDRYEAVYSTMLERTARPGDALLVFSVSADSPNLVQAAVSARRRGLTVLGVLGRPGQVHRHSQVAVVIDGHSYGRAENVQLSVCHILTSSYVHQCHQELHHA